jgi:protein-disulfide isomerase
MDEETEIKVEDQAQAAPTPSSFPPRSRPGTRPIVSPTNWFLWFTFPLVFMLGMLSGWFIWGQSATTVGSTDTLTEVKRYDVSADDDPFLGPQNAPVTVIEFSDYQCPFCTKWYDTVASRLLTDYKGKIRFVYRDLPLIALHPDAQSAAEAANCAGEQNKYWEYHDALFGEKNGFGLQAYLQYASDLGLDVESFKTCVSERRYKKEVDADSYFARNLGINSTPTFFINGLLVVGAQPYEVFQQTIDNELAAAAAPK